MEKQPDTCPHCGATHVTWFGEFRDCVKHQRSESPLFPGMFFDSLVVEFTIDYFCMLCKKYVFTEVDRPEADETEDIRTVFQESGLKLDWQKNIEEDQKS